MFFKLCLMTLFSFVDFGCHGGTSAAIGAQLGALGAANVDFGSIWQVIWEPFGILGRPHGAVSEPCMASVGVFFVHLSLGGFVVANSCQNCLKEWCPGTAQCS